MARSTPLQVGVDLERGFDQAPPPDNNPKSIEFMLWDLARSGLVPEDMSAYPTTPFAMGTVGTYVFPYPDARMWKQRIDRRLVESSGEKLAKYKAPQGITDIWWPKEQDLDIARASPTLYIVEGEKKAAKFHKQWPQHNVVGIAGCYNAMYTLDNGSKALLPNLLSCLRPGKHVVIVFDGDIETNYGVQFAANALKDALTLQQCTVAVHKPPLGKGVDDWLVEDPNGELADLLNVPIQGLQQSRKQLFKHLGLALNDDGNAILNESNAALLIGNRFKEHVYYDRRLGLIMDGAPASIDDLESQAIAYVQRELVYAYPASKVLTGLRMWLQEIQRNKHDLVQDMLRRQVWDKVPRLDNWGSKHFETDFPEYADDWGRILITGLALRILEPGTKCDQACILAGAQGIGKSTFFEELATFDDHRLYYACTEFSTSGGDTNRTQAISFSRAVIVDLAEGVIFEGGRHKTSMDRVKQAITQVQDEYREVYAKGTCVTKRGFVFVGTTNRRDQHSDQTGSRRFLNMWVTKIQRLSFEDKMQLLAEVKHHEHQIRGSRWFDLRVTVDMAPASLREENEHITNIQELLNTQFQTPDAIGDKVRQILDSGQTARLKSGEMYITAGFISNMMGELGSRSTNMIARQLSALRGSPTFPYNIEISRKRLPQLEMTQQQMIAYSDGITNNQSMVNGYIITRKAK